jgi:hypothetical protein
VLKYHALTRLYDLVMWRLREDAFRRALLR